MSIFDEIWDCSTNANRTVQQQIADGDAVISAYIRRGGDINAKDLTGYSVLFTAASQGHAGGVKKLLAAGADVDAQTNDGETALCRALGNGYPQIAKLLVEAGADANIAGAGGKTALMLATERGWDEVVALLLERNKSSSSPRALPQQLETRSYTKATHAALTLVQEKLPVSNYNDIDNYNKKLSWAGELFQGSISEIEMLLTWNLRRLSNFPGFNTFYVRFKNDTGVADWIKAVSAIEITADFSNMVDCIEVCRTESKFFVFGNRSFTRPDETKRKIDCNKCGRETILRISLFVLLFSILLVAGFYAVKWINRESFISTLKDSKNDNEGISAAKNCAKMGKEVVSELIFILRHEDKEPTRRYVAYALAEIGKEAVPELILALPMKEAVYALYMIAKGKKEAIPEIIPAVPALIKALEDFYPEVQIYAAYTLGEIGTEAKQAIPALIHNLYENSERRVIKKEFVPLLGKQILNTDQIPDEAFTKLVSPVSNDDVRNAAAEALVKMGKEALPALLKQQMLQNNQYAPPLAKYASSLANKALLKMGKEVAPAIAELVLFQEQNGWASYQYELATDFLVGAMPKEAVPFLIQSLKDSNSHRRCRAIEILRKIGEEAKEAVPALIVTLKDEDKYVRSYSAHTLINLVNTSSEAKEAVPALIVALKDSFDDVRRNAAKALGKIGLEAREAIPSLIITLKDSNDDIRRAAAHALENINPEALRKYKQKKDEEAISTSLLNKVEKEKGMDIDNPKQSKTVEQSKSESKPAENEFQSLLIKKWNNYNKQMKAEFEKIDKGGMNPEIKKTQWAMFLDIFAQDNPYSEEDESIKANVRKKINECEMQLAARKNQERLEEEKQLAVEKKKKVISLESKSGVTFIEAQEQKKQGSILSQVLAVFVEEPYSMSSFAGLPIKRNRSEGQKSVLVVAIVKVAGQKKLSEFILKGKGKKTWTPVAVAGKLSDVPDLNGRSYFFDTNVVATSPNSPIGLLFFIPKDCVKKLSLYFRNDINDIQWLTVKEWLDVRKKLIED